MNKKDIEHIMNWCYKNNTVKLLNSNLRLATTDGGWVNVLELRKFLNNEVEDEF